MNKLLKVWRLPAAEWVLLATTGCHLLAVHIMLRLVSFKTMLSWIRSRTVPKNTAIPDPIRLAYLIEVAARHHVVQPTCLDKSLVLYSALRKRGVDSELAIGTLKKNGAFQAHAWVEYQGIVILGQTSDNFAPLWSTTDNYK
jgi:hypothetical protein